MLQNLLRRAWRRAFPPPPRPPINPFLRFAAPGHFYSPIPDLEYVARRRQQLFETAVDTLPGIDLNLPLQLSLLEEFGRYYSELPFQRERSPALRFHFPNDYFGIGDAIGLYSMLRHLRPRRVVEVGVGFSSAVMLDTNDRFLDNGTSFTFVDPNPERLESLGKPEDLTAHRLLRLTAQDVPMDVFTSLQANDLLFIDSSHVVKIGSDVVHLIAHVLPNLKDGVVVHFHDVFWPFEYPEDWLHQGIAWNEDYLLRAFLQFNDAFEIRFFTSYLFYRHRQAMADRVPLALEDPGGSLYIAKGKTPGRSAP